MKLQHVLIENFRSIKSLDFEFPASGLLVLVGANNAGKSNIIRAIDALCGDAWFGREKVEPPDHYLRDPGRTIKLKLEFDNGTNVSWSSTSQSKWPEYKSSSGEKLWKINIKDAFPCTYLGSDRSLERHVSFNEWTLLSKIKRHFNREASGIEDALLQKYGEILSLFKKVEGFNDFVAGFEMYFSQLQADTPAKLSIGFKPYTPQNYFKTFQILTEDPQQLDRELGLEELGEGSRNTVLISLLLSYARYFKAEGKGIIALEEPELFLHPHARRHLFKALREVVDAGHQVILSTHSTSFVDTELFDSIGRVVKVDDEEALGRKHTALKVVSKADMVALSLNTGAPKDKVSEDRIGPFYRATAHPKLNEGFFSRFLLLVEGETEELALPIFLTHSGIDCDLHGVSILPVGGKGNLPKYWRLFTAFDLPVLTIFDNDSGTETKKGANQILETCMGWSAADNLENVEIYKPMKDARGMETVSVVFQKDYETALDLDWRRFAAETGADKDAVNKLGIEASEQARLESKGLKARYVARHLTERHSAFVPSFVRFIGGEITTAIGAKPR